jgi:hypothetical protein
MCSLIKKYICIYCSCTTVEIFFWDTFKKLNLTELVSYGACGKSIDTGVKRIQEIKERKMQDFFGVNVLSSRPLYPKMQRCGPHNFYAAPAPGKNFDAAPAVPTLLYSKVKIFKTN